MRRVFSYIVVVVLVVGATAFWEFSIVEKRSGWYEVFVTIRGADAEQVTAVSYARLSSRVMVPSAIESYPAPKPIFYDAEDVKKPIAVGIGFLYKESPLGRTWDYTQKHEVLLFRIEFADRPAIFRTLDAPPRDGAGELVLDVSGEQ